MRISYFEKWKKKLNHDLIFLNWLWEKVVLFYGSYISISRQIFFMHTEQWKILHEYVPRIQNTIHSWTWVNKVFAGLRVSFNKLCIFSSLVRDSNVGLCISNVVVMVTPLSVNRNVAAANKMRKHICDVACVMNFVTGQRITSPGCKKGYAETFIFLKLEGFVRTKSFQKI